jgi:plasmid stabilization system protein ParE
MNNLELEITSKAYNDMEIISEFIAQDNKTAANKRIKKFFKQNCR